MWAPAIRDSSSTHDFLEFDFLQPVRVSGVDILAPDDFRAAAEVRVEYGESPGDIGTLLAEADVSSDSQVTFAPVVARYFKITVLSTTAGDPLTKALALNG